jgi:hypothetical protein
VRALRAAASTRLFFFSNAQGWRLKLAATAFFRLKFALIVGRKMSSIDVAFVPTAAEKNTAACGAPSRGVINFVLEPYEDIHRGRPAECTRTIFCARQTHRDGKFKFMG